MFKRLKKEFPDLTDEQIQKIMKEAQNQADDFRKENNEFFNFNGTWSHELSLNGKKVKITLDVSKKSDKAFIKVEEGETTTTHSVSRLTFLCLLDLLKKLPIHEDLDEERLFPEWDVWKHFPMKPWPENESPIRFWQDRSTGPYYLYNSYSVSENK